MTPTGACWSRSARYSRVRSHVHVRRLLRKSNLMRLSQSCPNAHPTEAEVLGAIDVFLQTIKSPLAICARSGRPLPVDLCYVMQRSPENSQEDLHTFRSTDDLLSHYMSSRNGDKLYILGNKQPKLNKLESKSLRKTGGTTY